MARMLSPDPSSVMLAAQCLAQGGLVGMPTETVYGLAANAYDGQAVARIFAAKGRPAINPLIAHYPDPASAMRDVAFDARAQLLAQQFWPGPLTMVLPRLAGCRVAPLASAGLPTQAVRVPAHPVALSLLRVCGFPLVAPSANPSGTLSPTTPLHVAQGLGEKVDIILAAGACAVGLESTVIDLSGPVAALLRPGAISVDDLRDVLGQDVIISSDDKDAPKSPGQLLKHYAPRIPLRLKAVDVMRGEAVLGFGSMRFIGIRGGGSLSELPESMVCNLSQDGDLHEAASNMFAMLHALDKPEHSGIAVMPIPDVGLGIAINDRLRRANVAQKSP